MFDEGQHSRLGEARLDRILRYMASHVTQLLDRAYDELTGLPAWPLFEPELAAAATRGEGVLLVMDVDRLHVFNETFGREVGNEVLQHLAGVLRETLPGQLLTRVTGDQFAALLHHVDLDEARSLGERICVRFRERRFELDGQVHRALLSIGLSALDAVADSDGGMGAARVALQAAKDRGRGRVEVYQSADASLVQRTDDLQMLGYVRNAIESNRLVLVAQPLMALRPGRVMNYSEVLVRILDEDGRHVPPGEFMSAAERYQLMEDLDRWVVRTTLALLAEHGSHLDGRVARFAVNLSGQSLGSRQFLHFVESAIRSSGVPPELIAFEITESVAVSKMQQVQVFMQAMRVLGCHFSLDDFGTGLSSFAYLKLFPVDTLKIDGSFVRDLAGDVVSQSVVAAVAELARVLQMETVAEFVGDQDSLELLRRLNIGWAQGHFVGATGLLADRIGELDRGLRPPEVEMLPAAAMVAGGR
ncbi:MAG: EAL domain-containing protein [Gammaproteobacteria bacterium]|nr:EAL domain-containing protein [Gammaproteobacteria bacterium]